MKLKTSIIILAGCFGIFLFIMLPIVLSIQDEKEDYVASIKGSDFSLNDVNNNLITEKSFQGPATALFFGFTHCPDVCPMTLNKLSIILKRLKQENKSLKVFAGTGEPQKAEMTLDVFGEIKKSTETGDGPVDATFKCIKTLYPHDVNLQLYQVHAVTEGTDAQATVSVKIEENGKTTVGQAADTDTLVASANAYINALNKMIIKRDKTAPEHPQNYETQKMKGI